MGKELRRRKAEAFFHRLDANANGVLERDDFDAVSAKYIEHAGWAEDSPDAADMRELFTRWWDGICGVADVDNDGVITADEFATAVGSFAPEAFVSTGSTVFGAFDRSGDGLVSRVEYRVFLAIYGVDAARADEIFARMDLNGDGRISREEFDSLLVEWGSSEDEDAPGNWLFGPF